MGDTLVKDLISVYKTGEPEVIALRSLDCTIKGSEVMAIMGPSGCGKTILIVTHDQRIGEIADTVMTIVDGRITGSIPGSTFTARILASPTKVPAT